MPQSIQSNTCKHKEVKTMNSKGSSNWKMNQVLLHDNTRQHTSLRSRKTTATVLRHPPYSPNLAPSNFQLLAPQRMHSKDATLQMMMSWTTVCIKSSDTLTKNFMWVAYSISWKDGKSVLKLETLSKNNINFVKDVHITFVYFIITIIIIKLTWSGATSWPILVSRGLEVSWMVSSSFFCLLIYNLLIFSEIYYGAFCFCIFHYSCN
jgi:hypothetical protein